ncbi:MAG: hypothetical protein C0404_09995 [Verrucomicrobia bacterium]|nr:hypothetical protein [Verrucomicrobiota bacterium]
MDAGTLSKAREWYQNYVRGFAGTDGKLGMLLQLKLEHSMRVAADSAEIARQLGWSEQETNTAEALGLYHDVGRYLQLQRYNTFLDSISINHGECGYEITRDNCSAMFGDDFETIATSIRYHNRREIPDGIPQPTLPFLKLIRDADKVDILFVVNDTIKSGRHEDNPEILLNIDIKGPLNPALLQEFQETRNCSYKNVKSLADMCLMRVSWLYSLTCLPSLRMVLDRNVMKEILGTLPQTPEIAALEKQADEYVRQRIRDGRLVIQ